MKAIEVKFILSEDGLKASDALKTFEDLRANPMRYRTIKVSSLRGLQVKLERLYGEDISVQSGVSGGCYGARTGTKHDGLTVWCDLSLFAERCVDDGMEYVNPLRLLNAHGDRLDIEDAEAFFDILENTGVEVKHDNTYNYGGCIEDAEHLVDLDFKTVDIGDKILMLVRYHCGGDIRGNYTMGVIYSFDDHDALYSVLYPYNFSKEDVA